MNALYNTSNILISFWMKEIRILIFVLWLTFIFMVSFMKLGNFQSPVELLQSPLFLFTTQWLPSNSRTVT